VYLAFPDLILNVYLLGMYGSYANQKFNPKFYGNVIIYYFESTMTANGKQAPEYVEDAVLLATATANLYINAIIAYEVLTLLKHCNQVIPCDPPSVKKVHWQVAAAYVLAIIVSTLYYFMTLAEHTAFVKSKENQDESILHNVYNWMTFCLVLLVTLLIPVGYLCYVCTIIWSQHLLPSTTGRMKELAWYFFRIILVFVLTSIPGLILIMIGFWYLLYIDHWYIPIAFIFFALQSILSTMLAMTKSDVRKYVVNLLTLSYCRHKPAE